MRGDASLRCCIGPREANLLMSRAFARRDPCAGRRPRRNEFTDDGCDEAGKGLVPLGSRVIVEAIKKLLMSCEFPKRFRDFIERDTCATSCGKSGAISDGREIHIRVACEAKALNTPAIA